MIPIKRLEIRAQRWPWQAGYNWHGTTHVALLNPPLPRKKAAPRFGAGWKYEFGISVGAWSENGISIILNLIFGMIRIRYRTRQGVEAERRRQELREARDRRQEAVIAKARLSAAVEPQNYDDVPF